MIKKTFHSLSSCTTCSTLPQKKGYFVTATGTDIGKTFVTGLLVKKWRDSGIDAGYYKAALSGAEFRDGQWIAGDADYVKRIAKLPDTQAQLVSYVYKEAVSPHLAARKEGNPVNLEQVIQHYEEATTRHNFIFVEGSGGIICPIRDDIDDQGQQFQGGKTIFLEDIIKAVQLPLLIVTTAVLGSINACVLTVEYARSKGLPIRGIIVNRYGESGNFEMEDDNIHMMKKITGLEILAKIKFGDTDLGVNPF